MDSTFTKLGSNPFGALTRLPVLPVTPTTEQVSPPSSAGSGPPSVTDQFDVAVESAPGPPAAGATHVGANVNVSNEAGPQSETDIAVDPTDPKHLLGGSNSITQDGAMRVFESFDAGATWTHDQLPKALSPLNGFSSDPAVTFDKKGGAYYSFLGIDSAGQQTGLVCLTKPAGSTTWGAPVTVPNVKADKNLMTSDLTDGPHAGNVYIGWDNNNTDGSQSLMLGTSSNEGKAWSTAKVNNTGNTVIGAQPAVGPNGEVYVGWSNYKDHTLNLNVSTDGGKTFGTTDNLVHKWTAPTGSGLDVKIPSDPQRGVTVFPSIDVDRSNGPNRGTVYCVYNDGDTTAGLSAFLTKSTDGGKSWSQPLRVNDDAAPGRQDHFMPRVAVDETDGSVNVVWYDTRNDTSDKKTDVYYARSTDGGSTFEPNVRVTTASSDETGANGLAAADATIHGGVHAPAPKKPGERTTGDVLSDANGYGDYLGLSASGGHIHPLWTDSRSGNLAEEVYSADIVPGSAPQPPVDVQGSAVPKAFFNRTTPASSVIHLDSSASIANLKVGLDVSHKRASGLTVTLTSPSGKAATVPVHSGKQLKDTFDVSQAFAGAPVQGDWTLSVHSSSKTDTGVLNAWNLDAAVA